MDDNGYLKREEFDLFQMKSGGDQCDDDAWQVMKGKGYLLAETDNIIKVLIDCDFSQIYRNSGLRMKWRV